MGTADIHDVGLLSNFRRQSNDVEGDSPDETPVLDFEFGDESAEDDEQWLQAVDRRKPAPDAEEADPFLQGLESDVPAAAPVPAADDDRAVATHAQPATMMSSPPVEPMAMVGQPDFPAEGPLAPPSEPGHSMPAFESYDLIDTEDPPVAFAYAEERPQEIVDMHHGPSGEEADQGIGAVEPVVAGIPVPTGPLQEGVPEELPDLGMVFAGLSSQGIIPAGQAASAMAPPAPPQIDPIDIGFGPVGPEALPHLEAMGLTVGVSWPQVTQARRSLMEQNPADGTADQQFRRTEVNHASASLRLLRVGPRSA